MTLSISIGPDVEARLHERAAAAGEDPSRFAARLLEDAIATPSVDELLAPFRAQVAASGLSDAELDNFYEELRDKAWIDRHNRPSAT